MIGGRDGHLVSAPGLLAVVIAGAINSFKPLGWTGTTQRDAARG
jgi:hypothetical protein